MTAFPSSETAITAFRNGAFDYIVKPFNHKDILAVAEKAHSYQTEVSEKERLVENLRKAICENFFSTTEALLLAIDAKDSYTASHSKNVSKLFPFVAEKLNIHHSRIEVLQYCAFLHDIGKIGISDTILTKPWGLTEEEFSIIKRHPDVGYNILEPIEFLKNGLSVVRHHHERYDGKGYPEGLKGDEIPFEAAILSVIDAYDAITSDRPYGRKLSHDNALDEIEKKIGTQFVPVLTKKVISSIDEYFKTGRDETPT
jgi:HD-GYP domain-containing protein (c-di-GMP phosphodiesterase class II)